MLQSYETALKAAADPNRARILKMLESGELCVCQIVAVLGLSVSTVSKHLSLLRAAGLIEERKAGRWVYLRLAEADGERVAGLLSLVRDWLADDPAVRADAERVARVRAISAEELCCLSPEGVERALATAAGANAHG